MARHLIAAAVTALLVTGCAAEGDLYTGLDTDADGFVDEREFTAGVNDFGVFADWDSDNDRYLDDEEFGWGMDSYGIDYDPMHGYDSWDLNDDDRLDQNEFYGGTFDELDADDDGLLDENEFNVGIRMTM